MKTFKVRASYSAMCETEIKANDIDEAYALAQKLDGSVYDTHCDPDDWHIEDVWEVTHHPDCPAIDGFGCRCNELKETT